MDTSNIQTTATARLQGDPMGPRQLIAAKMAMHCMEETRSENVEMMVTGPARNQSARDVSRSN